MDIALARMGGKNMGVFFNVEHPVGPNCPNVPEDVMLVQYLLRKLGQAMFPGDDPGLQARFSAVQATGDFDAATADSILRFQKRFTAVADGRVSPAKGISFGKGLYTIYELNYWMKDMYHGIWPRLQDLKDCPSYISMMMEFLL